MKHFQVISTEPQGLELSTKLKYLSEKLRKNKKCVFQHDEA